MHALDISEQLWREYGAPMLEREGCLELAAAGMAGQGSECFGWDDEVSRDHDLMPGFTIWLTREADAKIGFALMRAYAKLPKSYMGLELSKRSAFGASSGTSKYGVRVIGDFLLPLIGTATLPADPLTWLYMSEHGAACATNGRIFHDSPGIFTGIRRTLTEGIPPDVRRKKLAARAALMAQSGQYNLPRTLAHGERAAASLAASEFVNHALYFIFALNRVYLPFYKWRFRALEPDFRMSEAKALLERIIIGGQSGEELVAIVSEVCELAVRELLSEGLSDAGSDYLENHAIALMAGISTPVLRSLHIMDCGE